MELTPEELAANDQQKAIDDVQAAVDKIDFDGGNAPAGEPAAPTPDPEPEPTEADGEPTPEPEPDPEPDAGEAEPEPTPEPEPEDGEADKPALSDSHYRAALRMGMTAEDISELYDSSPALAAKTLAKCHDMVNASSRQLGELGRAAQKVQATPEPQPQPADGRVDKLIAKVTDHYGDDDPMAEVLTELLKDRQPKAVPTPEPRPEPIPQRGIEEEIAARQQINTFFGADDMTAYSELYGDNESALGGWTHLTPGQRANRLEVCERAQILLYGAEASGMEMGTAEAMERAHLEVSAPMAEQIVRNRIVKSVKKRERGVTLAPSGQPRSERSGGEYNHKEAVADVAAEIRKVLG